MLKIDSIVSSFAAMQERIAGVVKIFQMKLLESTQIQVKISISSKAEHLFASEYLHLCLITHLDA